MELMTVTPPTGMSEGTVEVRYTGRKLLPWEISFLCSPYWQSSYMAYLQDLGCFIRKRNGAEEINADTGGNYDTNLIYGISLYDRRG